MSWSSIAPLTPLRTTRLSVPHDSSPLGGARDLTAARAKRANGGRACKQAKTGRSLVPRTVDSCLYAIVDFICDPA